MEETYRHTAIQSGTEAKQRMLNIMADKMQHRDIFAYIHDQIRTECTRLLDRMTDDLSDHVIEMCNEIQRQVDLAKEPDSEVSRTPAAQLESIRRAVEIAKEELEQAKMLAMPARKEAVALRWEVD